MPTLSICIPTYNRSKLVVKCVNALLECRENDMEVIVSDNCSQDDTWKQLSSIKDTRLRIFRNPENKGAYFNIMKVLSEAKGKFATIFTDEDTVVHKGLSSLISFLKENPNASYVKCDTIIDDGYNPYHELSDITLFGTFKLDTAFDAYKFASKFNFITGIVFNTEFMNIKNDYCLIFPHTEMAQYVSFFGSAYFLNNTLCINDSKGQKHGDRFVDTSGHSKDGVFWFEYEGITKIAIARLNNGLSCNFTKIQNISHMKFWYLYVLYSSAREGTDDWIEKLSTLMPHSTEKTACLHKYDKISENRSAFFINIITETLDCFANVAEKPFWHKVKDIFLSLYSANNENPPFGSSITFNKHETAQMNSIMQEITYLLFAYDFIKLEDSLQNAFTENRKMFHLLRDNKHDELVAMASNTIYCHFQCSKSYIAQGEFDSAINSMQEYLNLFEVESSKFMPCTNFIHLAEVYHNLAKLHLSRGEKNEAKRVLEAYLSYFNEVAETAYGALELLDEANKN